MRPAPREILVTIVRALLLGLALGLGMYFLGVMKDLKIALTINGVFAGVMWPAFSLLAPWFHPEDRGDVSPGRMAVSSLLRILALYTVLVFVCVFLIRAISGFDLMRYASMIVVSYLFGLVITAVMNSLHTTAHMVEAERGRARAQVDRLRLEVLEADNARKTQELEEARGLQLSMLPTDVPRRADLAVAFGMRTATEVGGDYYDVREATDGRLELVLGDATGHGSKAGLLVVAAKTLFQTEGETCSPAAALARANLGVKSLNLSRMNMALTRVSVEPGKLRLSAAGMPPALHYAAATGTVAEIVSDAPPTGQLRRAIYENVEVPFLAGDRLLLFSDGFPECLDPQESQLGYDEALAAFAVVASKTPREIVDALFAKADAWAQGRPFDDDVSFLVLARLS